MYTEVDYKTKKELKEAVSRGDVVRVYEPGIQTGLRTGRCCIEGPHYPRPHRWYAEVEIVDRVIVKIRG